MMMEVPITYSWPSSRPKQQATDNPDDSDDLQHQALEAWVAALSCELGIFWDIVASAQQPGCSPVVRRPLLLLLLVLHR